MHVSSRNMFPTTRNLQICVHVYRPSSLLWRLINFRLFCSDDCRSWPREEKFWSDDCRSWPHEEKINNHGSWGKHAHIPDNDYWGSSVCFMSCEPIFFCNYSYVVHTVYIFNFFSSTEHCAWAIISPKEFKSWVTRISFALLYGENRIICCQIFYDLLLKSAFKWIFNVMQLILVKIKWHTKVKIFNPKMPRYLPFILL